MNIILLLSRLALICTGILLGTTGFSQVAVNSSGQAPHPSAGLDIDFNDKGVLLPRLTTAQRMGINSPAAGLIIFNTDLNCPEYFDGSNWMAQCGTVQCNQAPQQVQALAATAIGTTGFTANWNAVAGAQAYLIDVATDAQFLNILPGYGSINAGSQTTFQVTGLTPGSNYHYRIFAQNTCGTSAASNAIMVTTPTNTGMRVFITSQSYNANLGGVTGADNICQGVANNAGLGGSWKAWISQSGSSPSTRFTQSSTPYILLNGTVIANNWADLTDGTLANPINIDENGQVQTSVSAWSNTTISGTFDSNSNGGCGGTVCGSWTIGGSCNNPNCGQTGNSGATDQNWTRGGAACCHVNMRLYCFEQ